jgi:hypothetical protein
MRYGLLLTLDQEHEPTGFFSFETTVGSIVIAFTDSQRLQSAARAAAEVMAQSGTKIGSIEVKAASSEDLMAQLLAVGWDSSEGNLVLDSDPLGSQLLAQLVQS